MIKIGSIIRVIKPHIFIRCGYPLTLGDEAKRIKSQFSTEINELLHKILGTTPSSYAGITHIGPPSKLVKQIAYTSLMIQKFGGPERTIHTLHVPSIENLIGEVTSIKTCVTGTYYSGSTSGDYEDYEPPMLYNQKRHRIVKVSHKHGNILGSSETNNNTLTNDGTFEYDHSFWIESANINNLIPTVN